ncbi:hypothetical protein KA005_23825 [bacterium]|nr:hypothetical protein [bacterium]
MAWEIHPETKERGKIGKVCSCKTQKKVEREIKKYFKKGFFKKSFNKDLISIYPTHDIRFIEIKKVK